MKYLLDFEIFQKKKYSKGGEWVCNNNFLVDGEDTCPDKRIFGMRAKDIPAGHEIRMMYPNKFK